MAQQGEDSRQTRPKDMDEVNVLQEAMAPTFRSFLRVAGREPPFVDPWGSYTEQTKVLQDSSDACWRADSRRGHPPRLAKLSAWSGGILRYITAGFAVPEGAIAGYTHPAVERLLRPAPNNLLAEERKYRAACMRVSTMQLEFARAREKEHEEASEGVGRLRPEADIVAILDRVVAKDPDGYIAWLSAFGYKYYTSFAKKQKSLTWDDWCKYFAPTVYEACQTSPMGSSSGPTIYTFGKWGSEKAQRSLSERPAMTLEQALRGHEERKRS